MILSSDQAALFHEQGLLYLPQALPKRQVMSLSNLVLNSLQKNSVWSKGRILSRKWSQLSPFQQINELSQTLAMPDLYDRIVTPDLHDLIHKLAQSQRAMSHQEVLLISLPRQGAWTLSALDWHRDARITQQNELPGIQIFVLLQDLNARSGGTMAIPRTHQGPGLKLNKSMIDAYWTDIPSATLKVNETNLAAAEMVGKAGDVYLMDMRLLHTPTINASNSLRMMATVRFFKP